jgi:DNA-binding NarL/FixJ family response regulator
MQAHIMTDDSWTEFKKIFLKVYPNFFFGIKNTFSHLSETDIRLLTLIKLQSSNKEMANMLGITVEGVKKAKQRLRKKMNLDEQVGYRRCDFAALIRLNLSRICTLLK